MADVPVVVVVGAACRDLVHDDPRGWRLGGGVTYAALTLARLGLPVGALIGADRLAAESRELHLLRDAGVDVVVAPLAVGPVFINTETPDRPHPARPAGLGPGRARRPAGGLARRARAGCSRRSPPSCPDAWADVPPRDALVAPRLAGPAAGPRGGRAGHAAAARAVADRRAGPISWASGRDDFDPGTTESSLLACLHPGSHDAVHGRRARRRGDRGGPGRRRHRAPAVDADPGRALRGPGRGRRHVPRRRLRRPRRPVAARPGRGPRRGPPGRRRGRLADLRGTGPARRAGARRRAAADVDAPPARAPARDLAAVAAHAGPRGARPRRWRSASRRGWARPSCAAAPAAATRRASPRARPPGSPRRCSRSFATSIQAITPSAAAGGRRGLPRLRRLGPPPEPPQHPRPLGGEPLVRPAAGRLPCPAGVPGGRTRRGPERTAAAVREVAPPAAIAVAARRSVGRTLGVHHASRSSSRRSCASGGRDRRPPERVADGRRRGQRVVEARERLVVAPVAAVGPREPGEVAARRLVAGRPVRVAPLDVGEQQPERSGRPSRCGSRRRRAASTGPPRRTSR